MTSVQDQVVAIARPQLEVLIERTRANFMASFGDFVQSAHRADLERLMKEAAEAKLNSLTESDEAKAKQWAQIADTKLNSISTLGLAVQIVGEAKAHSFLKEAATQVLDTLVSVAAVVLKVVVTGVIQGAISSVTGGSSTVGGGIANIASSFLGDRK